MCRPAEIDDTDRQFRKDIVKGLRPAADMDEDSPKREKEECGGAMKKMGETVLNVRANSLPDGKDRHSSTRLSCEEKAEIIVFPSGFLYRGEITSLSETGCFIATMAPLKLQPSNLVALRFTIGTHSMRLEATVAEVTPRVGVDLEFLPDMEKSVRTQLNTLCEGLSSGRIHSGPKM
jgi:hypothetical protein